MSLNFLLSDELHAFYRSETRNYSCSTTLHISYKADLSTTSCHLLSNRSRFVCYVRSSSPIETRNSTLSQTPSQQCVICWPKLRWESAPSTMIVVQTCIILCSTLLSGYNNQRRMTPCRTCWRAQVKNWLLSYITILRSIQKRELLNMSLYDAS